MRLFILLFCITLLSACKVFQTPSYKDFKNFKISKIGLKESDITVDLIYHNHNRYGFDINKSDLDVYIDGVYVGKSITDSSIHVDKRSDFTIPITLKTDMKNIFTNIWNSMTHKTVLFQAKGTINAGVKGINKTFDIDYEGRHEIKLLNF
jgi:LEA14-like dessication related protein